MLPAAAPFLIAGGIAALLGGGVYAAFRAQRQRREDLRTAAQAMGFSFEEDADLAAIGDFPLFARHGRRRRLTSASRGKIAGRAVLIGDYSYVVSSGNSSRTVRQTIVLFADPVRDLPDFDLSPENVLHRLAEVFGYQDIDFEQHEEFSKRYLLRGRDEEAIRRVFGTDALTLLGGQPGWSIQTRDGRLIVFRAGKTTRPAEIPAFAAEALRIAGAVSPRGPS